MYKVPNADGRVNVQDLLQLLSNADLQQQALMSGASCPDICKR